jgi:translation initiation factor IF-1
LTSEILIGILIAQIDMAELEVVEGIVDEALPNTLFRVKLESGEVVLAYLSGKMRLHRIKVLVGDRVELHLDPYGGRARVTRRI